jgi:2'-5' RNA ligase
VILVPEAEPIVGSFREKYTPSAKTGMPAHITLLYPFKHPGQVDDRLLRQLKQLFLSYNPFEFSLVVTGRFPDVLYLAPEPDTPFKELTGIIAERYPETPPFEGRFSDPIPHLTVARGSSSELDRIEEEFYLASTETLPIDAIATEVWLLETREGVWYKHTPLALGSKQRPLEKMRK